ncbi:D-glycero-beta-D-manno-heptose-7-phosphate kinase [Sedimenticola hydrogenitrophicus]|uniref:D-glycero-beta-D-manno-heptose-7-phosphate kinase n=1 Tax=Sedimenticola hydrogenitrophicus TaxID=2967975 RepID=UPI0023B0FBEB|nr:D-glycero-beta-D-manno-heptose-7-phosphate kinase [Sedimenticola hydrogenitrophicus]
METETTTPLHILVVGDLMIDHYLWGECSRISPEAPVQVVDVTEERALLGGAGNVVNNLVALGSRVSVAGVIGGDEAGRQLVTMMRDLGVNTEHLLLDPRRKTSKKSRVVASHQQVVRFDSECRVDISPEHEQQILQAVERLLPAVDLVLLSDYAKGVLTETLVPRLIALCNNQGKRVLVDPKGSDYSRYQGAYLITPNRKEAALATAIPIGREDENLESMGFALKRLCNLSYAIITLSEDGMAIFGETMQRITTHAKEVYDVTGAGDTVLAALGFALACGRDIETAAHFANSAAAVVVGKLGSATATLDEIEEYESSLHKAASDAHIKNFDSIERIVGYLKRQDKRIVFTNGCFDILHLGHIKSLEKAKSFGDVLVVGVNSDASVRRLKGADRPINPEYDRAYLLAALEAVDYVVIFDQDTPYELVKRVLPDVLVKGSDYRGKEIVGSDLAGEVKLVDIILGKSTSRVIDGIKVER